MSACVTIWSAVARIRGIVGTFQGNGREAMGNIQSLHILLVSRFPIRRVAVSVKTFAVSVPGISLCVFGAKLPKDLGMEFVFGIVMRGEGAFHLGSFL